MVSENDVRKSGIFDFQVFPTVDANKVQGTGNNQKNILVCLADENTDKLNGFLEKVFTSVGIELGKDAFTVFLSAGQTFNFTALDQQMGFEKAIFMGLKLPTLGINLNLQPYQPFIYQDKTFLMTDALSSIQQTPALKRPLWEGLKKVMGS